MQPLKEENKIMAGLKDDSIRKNQKNVYLSFWAQRITLNANLIMCQNTNGHDLVLVGFVDYRLE